jgi:hypothetical protein
MRASTNDQREDVGGSMDRRWIGDRSSFPTPWSSAQVRLFDLGKVIEYLGLTPFQTPFQGATCNAPLAITSLLAVAKTSA